MGELCRSSARLSRDDDRRVGLLRLRKSVRFRAIAGEGVILSQDRGEVLVVNGVGTRVVELLQHDSTLDDIVATLHKEHEVEVSTLRKDICAFLEELEQAEVLESEST